MKRENYDAAVHGYTFLLLITPFSFVTLFKNMIDKLWTIFEVYNPKTPPPFPCPTTFQKKEDQPPHFDNCSAGPDIE